MEIADPVLTKHLKDLKDLNEAINDAENEGKSYFLQTVLAPVLAFRRGNKAVADDQAFLLGVKKAEKPEEKRTIDVLEPIHVFGERAFVECVVTVGGKH